MEDTNDLASLLNRKVIIWLESFGMCEGYLHFRDGEMFIDTYKDPERSPHKRKTFTY